MTDYSNASRTMLFNINTLQWDDEILSRAGHSQMHAARGPCPPAVSTARPIPPCWAAPSRSRGAAGDQQAALFGQACFHPGEAKNTYGTGCLPADEHRREARLLQTTAWSPPSPGAWTARLNYALEGSVFVAGAAIQWLRDELQLIESAPDSEYYASKVKDTNGCYVVPAFTGLGAPHWDQYARGTIVGITRGVNKNHIIRATMESLAYQVNDILVAMQADSGIQLAALNVDGGASRQQLADADCRPISSGAPVQPSHLRGNHRHGRGLPGRSGRWLLGQQGRRCPQPGHRPGFPPENHRGSPRRQGQGLEQGREVRLRLGKGLSIFHRIPEFSPGSLSPRKLHGSEFKL